MFTIMGNLYLRSLGSVSFKKYSLPGFSNPTQFSMPEGVSTTRWPLLPARGARVVPFTVTAPTFSKSRKSVNSRPKPKVPEAVVTGVFIFRPAISTARRL